MRRRDKEITDPADLKRILREAKYVTLAMSIDNQPYLVSLSHGYDEEQNCIYFHCANEGKKLHYLSHNDRVWGQALLDLGYAEGKCNHVFYSVHFSGRVTFLDSTEDKMAALQCMIRQLDKNPELLLAKLEPKRLNTLLMGKISIEYMSGKKPPQ